MNLRSVTIGTFFLVLFFAQLSHAQDAEKARALLDNSPTIYGTTTSAKVDCVDNRAGQYDCSDVDLVAVLSVTEMKDALNTGSSGTNDIWGWTDPETGIEYALVGMNNGTMFVELSNPESPQVVGFLPTTTTSSPWRDIKVYQDHAFIVADAAGQHGMQVFDLTTLRTLTEPTTLQATALYERIASAHNIVINESSGFAFAVGSNSGGTTCGGALHMINIQDPVNPTFARCFVDASTGIGFGGYTHDAQCVNYNGPDTEHQGKEICIGSNENYISIADVTDKLSPVALSKATYPEAAYIHQGWLTEDQRYFFQDDEGDEGNGKETRTLIWDLVDLDDPVLLGDFFSGVQSVDHNLYILGDYLYQANYTSGLRIWDISDPENPTFAAFFDTYIPSNGSGFSGAWSNYPYFESGNVIVSDIGGGLFVLKPNLNVGTSTESPEIVASFEVAPPFPNPARGTATLMVTSQEGGDMSIEIIDATGRIVKSFTESSLTPDAATRIELDTQGLSNGSYLVRVRNETGVQVHPLTVVQ